MVASKYIIILITAPIQDASAIAKHLIERHVAACVNIIPEVRSIYYWKNEICDDKEALLIVKTESILFERLKEEVRFIHSYEVPEIIALPIAEGYKPYLNWISQVVKA